MPSLTLTFWPSMKTPAGVSRGFSVSELLATLRTPKVTTDKHSLPGFALASFRDNYRDSEHLIDVCAIGLDVDSGAFDVEAIAALWKDFAGVVYSTFSSTPEAPRTRTILFTTRRMTPEEYPLVWTFLRDMAAEFGVMLDKATKDPTRLWFVPAVRPDASFYYAELGGAPLDVDGVLTFMRDRPAEKEEPAPAPILAGDGLAIKREGAARMLAAAWPPKGQRCDARLALSGACYHARMPEADAVAFVKAVHANIAERGDATDASLEVLVHDTYKRGAEGRPVAGWTKLEGLVDAGIVSTARGLVSAEADYFEEVKRGLAGAKVEPAPAKPDNGIFWDDWDLPLEPPTWLVDGLIPAGTVGALVAHGSSLKTWTMLSLGTAVAHGRAWLGKFGTKRGRVLIVDYESGAYELRRRVRLLEGGRVEGLGAWSYPTQRIDDVAFWKDIAAIEGVTLVCIDSLAEGTSPGVDENSTAAALPLQLAARWSEATGGSVLFVHHSKKDDAGDARKSVRGSTAIYAAMDWCYGFEQIEETASYHRSRIVCTKPCMGSKPAPFAVELTDRGLRLHEGLVAKGPETPEEIRETIREYLVRCQLTKDYPSDRDYALRLAKVPRADGRLVWDDMLGKNEILKVGKLFIPNGGPISKIPKNPEIEND